LTGKDAAEGTDPFLDALLAQVQLHPRTVTEDGTVAAGKTQPQGFVPFRVFIGRDLSASLG